MEYRKLFDPAKRFEEILLRFAGESGDYIRGDHAAGYIFPRRGDTFENEFLCIRSAHPVQHAAA